MEVDSLAGSSSRSEPMDLHPFGVTSAPNGRLALTLAAAWGAESKQHRTTLAHLLRRLADLEVTVIDGTVDSRPARTLPLRRRRLALRRPYPLSLDSSLDAEALRRDIGRASAAVKLRSGTKGGNPNRRIRLLLETTTPVGAGTLRRALMDGNRLSAPRSGGNGTPSRRLELAGLMPYQSDRGVLLRRQRTTFSTNPDLTVTGLRAHTKTQDDLAAALRRYGYDPRSAVPGSDAAFDLAWEARGRLHVAEVKSLSPSNQERQLRLGLGQVLRYQHLAGVAIAGSRPVAWLVTSRAPTDDGWLGLCADHDVHLTWSERLDDDVAKLVTY